MDAALLEWVSALVGKEQSIESLEELRDGRVLLKAIHDLLPDVFPLPGAQAASASLDTLLASLGKHFQGRGETSAVRLLREAESSTFLDISLLIQLVIWATVLSDMSGPQQQVYMDLCEGLSDETKEVIMDIVQRFGDGDKSSQPAFSLSGTARKPHAGELSFSPVPRPAAPVGELPDFMEVGLDDETRYRLLRPRYHAVMEEQERIKDECNFLRQQLKAEIKKRQAAEEAERMARAELRESDEARHRMKEENRALFEVRLDQEAEKFQEELKQRDKQLEMLREECDLARLQQGQEEKLAEQLALYKKKLEESQVWRREKEELRRKLEDISSQTSDSSGASEHLRMMLDRTRHEANALLEERDEAQRQVLHLQQELNQLREENLATAEELSHARREAVQPSKDAASSRAANASAGPGVERSLPRSPTGSGVEELRELLHTQKDDLLERLLVEKERATRAETTLQLKLGEVATLTERAARDAESIAALEEKYRNQTRQLSELAGQKPGEESTQVRELQTLLAQRERELQIHRWRSQTESNSLIAQESLMVSCFHEIGLKYHRLMLQNETFRRQLQDRERGTCDTKGARSRDAPTG